MIDEAIELAPIPDFFNAPSTGLIALVLFLREVESLTIHGFDWWATDKHHYGDDEKRGTLHKPKIEMEIIIKLIGQEKLSFL